MAAGTFLSRPSPWLRAVPVAAGFLSVVLFVFLPFSRGRFYGPGQVGIYVVLAAAVAWGVHWTSRTIEVGGGRVRLRSPLRTRELPLEGLRVEIRRGWWTRIVLRPGSGFGASWLEEGWRPSPLDTLREELPPEAFTEEVTPSLSEPGPAERE